MNRIFTYIKWLIPALYILYYTSTAFFSHIHIDDGGIYVHSHPFNKSDEGTPHTHPVSSLLQVINDLSCFQTDGQISVIWIEAISPFFIYKDLSFIYSVFYTTLFGTGYSLRAPPLY